MRMSEPVFDLSQLSLAEIALNFPQAIPVLNRHNLDYFCHGKDTLHTSCTEANVNAALLNDELKCFLENVPGHNRLNFCDWQAPLLAAFILQHHHHYVRHAIPQIKALLNTVCQVHAEDNPALAAVRSQFSSLAEELDYHLTLEELILFPAIKRMAQNEQLNTDKAWAANVRDLLIALEDEHESAGVKIKHIRSLTNNYLVPAYACPTYHLAFSMLQEFEKDLAQHIHLENNILFEKVKATL